MKAITNFLYDWLYKSWEFLAWLTVVVLALASAGAALVGVIIAYYWLITVKVVPAWWEHQYIPFGGWSIATVLFTALLVGLLRAADDWWTNG